MLGKMLGCPFLPRFPLFATFCSAVNCITYQGPPQAPKCRKVLSLLSARRQEHGTHSDGRWVGRLPLTALQQTRCLWSLSIHRPSFLSQMGSVGQDLGRSNHLAVTARGLGRIPAAAGDQPLKTNGREKKKKIGSV